MTDIQSRINELYQLYKSGTLTKDTYEAAVKALSGEDAEDTVCDDIDIDAGCDSVFAKDQGNAQIVKDAEAGVVGKNASVSGGIHFDESMDAKFKERADQIQGAVQAEKIDNLVLRYNDKKSWITALWDILKR